MTISFPKKNNLLVDHNDINTLLDMLNAKGLEVEYLVVGGGAGGGARSGGGGGAGQVITGTTVLGINSYSVSIGDGGSPGPHPGHGGTGGTSSFDGVDALGGGGGYGGSGNDDGNPGAAGGGGGGSGNTDSLGGNGNPGGDGGDGHGESSASGGGGGGGFTGNGQNGSSNTGGNGGSGYDTGDWTLGELAGGGGGGFQGFGGSAGTGTAGGGDGATSIGGNGGDAVSNTGSGGGGASASTADEPIGGSGASGVVAIRYPVVSADDVDISGGNISTIQVNGEDYKLHVFNENGSLSITGDGGGDGSAVHTLGWDLPELDIISVTAKDGFFSLYEDQNGILRYRNQDAGINVVIGKQWIPKSSDFTIQRGDKDYDITAATTVTLPSNIEVGESWRIKKATGYSVTISPSGNVINSDDSNVIPDAATSAIITYRGEDEFILSHNG